jgi:hypothetical protein
MWPLVRLVASVLVLLVGLSVAGLGGWAIDAGGELLARVGAPPPTVEPPDLAAVGLGTAVLLGLVLGRTSPVAHAVTLLHEFAHVLVATACGARPTGVVLHRTGGGHATYRFPARGRVRGRLYEATTAAAGYPAAAVFAAAAAALLALAGPRPVLWVTAAVAVVVTLLSRSWWAAAVSLALGALAIVALSERAEPYATGAVVALTVALSSRNLAEEVRGLRGRVPHGHDARKVQDALHLPAGLVRLMQVAVTLAATGLVAWHLAGSVT